MMKIPFVDLPAMHREIVDDALHEIERIVRQANFVLGEDVDRFEAEFAEYCGTKYAVGVDSGLTALKLALLAYDLRPGDEVIIPANTFIASAAAAVFIGLKPVFVDVSPGTYGVDLEQLEAVVTPRTRAIMPVHLYGRPEAMTSIRAFAERHHLLVVEDASQAHGAICEGRRVGSFGHVAGFSLYPAKNLGAFGEAGVVTTDDAVIADRIKAMRNCGQTAKYYHEYAPYNHRMDTLQAAVLRLKLRQLDEWNAKRQQVAAWYDELLAETHVSTPPSSADRDSVWHLYVVRTPQRDALRAYLADAGIATGVHYPIPVHLAPVYAHMGHQVGDFPVAEAEADTLVSLPLFPTMTREQVAYVAETIHAFEQVGVHPTR